MDGGWGKIITYIIQTKDNEYYCGKTNNLNKRIKEHLEEKIPHWFAFKDRKNIRLVVYLKGDYENKIKKFGIRNLFDFMRNYKIMRPQPPWKE